MPARSPFVLLPLLCGVLLLTGCPSKPEADPAAGTDSIGDAIGTLASSFKPEDLSLSRDDIEGGWLSLFDGQTFFGWKPQAGHWEVDGGMIVSEGEASATLFSVPFANFELLCEYEADADSDALLLLRSKRQRDDYETDCVAVALVPGEDGDAGRRVFDGDADRNPDWEDDPEWTRLRVTLNNDSLIVVAGGERIIDANGTDPMPAAGLIGFQTAGGTLRVRKLVLRPLGLERALTAETFPNWKIVPGSEGGFDWQPDESQLHITGGRGFLESPGTYGNFVLQFQARTNADGLNGGLFFRAEKGTADAPANGYEFQIENRFEGEDRSQPLDYGTGGLFRRQAARMVIANDREFFTGTLIAYGRRFATFVDGVLVANWVDKRKPNANPREGYREQPGHLSLQAHDPTTDIDVKNLRIREFPESTR